MGGAPLAEQRIGSVDFRRRSISLQAIAKTRGSSASKKGAGDGRSLGGPRRKNCSALPPRAPLTGPECQQGELFARIADPDYYEQWSGEIPLPDELSVHFGRSGTLPSVRRMPSRVLRRDVGPQWIRWMPFTTRCRSARDAAGRCPVWRMPIRDRSDRPCASPGGMVGASRLASVLRSSQRVRAQHDRPPGCERESA